MRRIKKKESTYLLLIAALTLTLLCCKEKTPTDRPFLMGLSAAPHERTPSGKIQAKHFLSQNSELLLEDFSEGVPWEEALHGGALPPEVLVSLRIRKRMLEGKPLVLYVSPFDLKRTNIATYWPRTAKDSVKATWSAKKFGNPELQTAYLKFCLELIRQFRPIYFGYAVDVNYFASARPDQWNAFINFSRDVYRGLKVHYPNLPIFVSFDACSFWKQPELQEQRVREMLSYSDFLAVSAYPHLGGYSDLTKLPQDFFARLAKIGSPKPFAIADTGYPHPPPGSGAIDENPQKRYLEFVLKESYKLQAKFVIWFHYRDFSKVVEDAQLKNRAPAHIELFESRKKCGLIDDAGNSKNSHSVWKQWFQLPAVKKGSNPS